MARPDDRASWAEMRRVPRDAFLRRSQADWADLFASLDVCVTPILATADAVRHPHHVARETFTALGPLQASAAPRLSRTPGSVSDLLAFPGEHTTAVLAGYGIAMEEIAALREREVIA